MTKQRFALAAAALMACVASAPMLASAQMAGGIDAQEDAAQEEAAPEEADAADDSELNVYVDGNLLFMTYHEIGHMLVHQLFDDDQRAERRRAEEDADDIATWLMLPDEDEDQQDEEILAAILGWVRGAATNNGVESSPHYPDDAQRAARIICYTYGQNPVLYAPLGQLFPRTVQSVNCQEEVAILKSDLEAWFGDAFVQPGQRGNAPIVRPYEETGPELQAARTYLIQSGILESAAEDIGQFVTLPNAVSFVAKSCGPGRYEFTYNTRTLTVTACYEAVDWLLRDAQGHEQTSEGVRSSSEDELGTGSTRVERRKRRPGR